MKRSCLGTRCALNLAVAAPLWSWWNKVLYGDSTKNFFSPRFAAKVRQWLAFILNMQIAYVNTNRLIINEWVAFLWRHIQLVVHHHNLQVNISNCFEKRLQVHLIYMLVGKPFQKANWLTDFHLSPFSLTFLFVCLFLHSYRSYSKGKLTTCSEKSHKADRQQ